MSYLGIRIRSIILPHFSSARIVSAVIVLHNDIVLFELSSPLSQDLLPTANDSVNLSRAAKYCGAFGVQV